MQERGERPGAYPGRSGRGRAGPEGGQAAVADESDPGEGRPAGRPGENPLTVRAAGELRGGLDEVNAHAPLGGTGPSARQIVEDALEQYRRPEGYEGHLVTAARR